MSKRVFNFSYLISKEALQIMYSFQNGNMALSYLFREGSKLKQFILFATPSRKDGMYKTIT